MLGKFGRDPVLGEFTGAERPGETAALIGDRFDIDQPRATDLEGGKTHRFLCGGSVFPANHCAGSFARSVFVLKV
jgi:hypothetical protein